MPSVEIAVTCTWFQKRLCWMLSSILQQKGKIPDIVFSVGYPVKNGNPTTEDVCRFFRGKGLNIKELPYPDMSKIQYRGLVRNDQLQKATCDWILFSDADMSYSPQFFENLSWQIENRFAGERRILSARRISLDKGYCKHFFNHLDENDYPCVVEGSGELELWPIHEISRNCAAGYFQLVNRKVVLEKGKGLYVDPRRNRDWSWFEGKHHRQGARSDAQFRSVMNEVRMMETHPQYHLNHERDNETGNHLEIQR